ncbi:MAG: hypothetical protein DMG59_10430 [Acidobacteria bacterium]|nr:MAG: hypothetical protein DMG59_10430 [Acidobacteriota bacterium]
MGFYERFELLELFRDDGIKTFQGREIDTGRPVQVHLFVRPDAPESIALLNKIEQLREEERRRILDRGENHGTPYIVTDKLVDHPGFREWLIAGSKTSKPPDAAEPKSDQKSLNVAGAWKIMKVAPPSSTSLDEQFASLFETSERPVVPPAAAQSQADRPPEAERTQELPTPKIEIPKPPVSEAGEFTRMFRAPAAPQPPASAPPAQQPSEFTSMFQAPAAPTNPAPPPKPAQQPGEFTSMFQAPAAPANPAPPPQPAQQPGEFTRMFQAPASQKPPAPSQPAAQEPGEFTRMFQAPVRPPAPAPEPTVSNPAPMGTVTSGEFTRFFQTPVAPGPLPQSPAVRQPLNPQAPGSSGPNRIGEFTQMFGRGDIPAAPSPVSPPVQAPTASSATQAFDIPKPLHSPSAASQQGPSEYTRMFSAPASLTLGQPAESRPPAPRAPQPAAKSYVPLILVLSGVLLFVVILIAFFALRPR